MTDQSASPTTHPYPVQEPASSPAPLSPVSGLSAAASLLVAVTALLGVVMSWYYWNSYLLVRDYSAGSSGVGQADLAAADQIGIAVTIGYLASLVAAGIVFLMWLWRARKNAEILHWAPHSRARGWVIGGWFVPVVNLWFPYQVVRDVWKVSDPATPGDHYDLQSIRTSGLIVWWWVLFLVGNFVDQYGDRLLRNEITAESLRQAAIANTIGTAAWIGAAVLIILTMLRVSDWQSQPRGVLAGQ